MKLTPDQQTQLAVARQSVSLARARDIERLKRWEHGGCLLKGSVRPDVAAVTPAEDQAIRDLWDALPGWTSWMTALGLLARE